MTDRFKKLTTRLTPESNAGNGMALPATHLTLPELVTNAEQVISRVHEQTRLLQDGRHQPVRGHHMSPQTGEEDQARGYKLSPEAVLRAGQDFVHNGVVGSELQARLLTDGDDGGTGLSALHASYQRVLERLSAQHAMEQQSRETALRTLQAQFHELESELHDLQISSALQLKEVSDRRDVILEALRAETAARHDKEKVLQEAVSMIRRLTGRSFGDFTAADMSLQLHQVSDQVVIQQAQIAAEAKAAFRRRLRKLIAIDVGVRAQMCLRMCLSAWHVVRSRRRFFRCQYARIASRRAIGCQFQALADWVSGKRVRQMMDAMQGNTAGRHGADKLSMLVPMKKKRWMLKEWQAVTRLRRTRKFKAVKGGLRSSKSLLKSTLRMWHMHVQIERHIGAKMKKLVLKFLGGAMRRTWQAWRQQHTEEVKKRARLVRLLRARLLSGTRKVWELWKHSYEYGRRVAKGMDLRDTARYTKILGTTLRAWRTRVDALLLKLRLRLRCVERVVRMRKRHFFESWFRVTTALRYLHLQAVKQQDDAQVQEAVSAVGNLTAELHNKDTALTRARQSLALGVEERSVMAKKIEELTQEVWTLQSGAQAAALALEDAMSQIAAEQARALNTHLCCVRAADTCAHRFIHPVRLGV